MHEHFEPTLRQIKPPFIIWWKHALAFRGTCELKVLWIHNIDSSTVKKWTSAICIFLFYIICFGKRCGHELCSDLIQEDDWGSFPKNLYANKPDSGLIPLSWSWIAGFVICFHCRSRQRHRWDFSESIELQQQICLATWGQKTKCWKFTDRQVSWSRDPI